MSTKLCVANADSLAKVRSQISRDVATCRQIVVAVEDAVHAQHTHSGVHSTVRECIHGSPEWFRSLDPSYSPTPRSSPAPTPILQPPPVYVPPPPKRNTPGLRISEANREAIGDVAGADPTLRPVPSMRPGRKQWNVSTQPNGVVCKTKRPEALYRVRQKGDAFYDGYNHAGYSQRDSAYLEAHAGQAAVGVVPSRHKFELDLLHQMYGIPRYGDTSTEPLVLFDAPQELPYDPQKDEAYQAKQIAVVPTLPASCHASRKVGREEMRAVNRANVSDRQHRGPTLRFPKTTRPAQSAKGLWAM